LTTSVFDRVRSIASDLFGVPPDGLSSHSSPEIVERWDSTQHLSFVLALEDTFHLQLSPEETERIRTIGEAAKLIEERLSVTDR
jgi:acyl carrier protein